MSKRFSVSVAAGLGTAAFVIGAAVPAMAASPNHREPGVPGTPQCHGQSEAYIQFGTEELGVSGIGKLAKALTEVSGEEVTVKDLQAELDEFCGG